jgi:hypothetical protein
MNIGCTCAELCDEYHGWRCSITDGACMYLIPNSKQCAKDYDEGPESSYMLNADKEVDDT